MPLVPLRILMIHRQLEFMVTVKKSLESLGGFEVATFTTAETALEYASTRPHDVAVVDFMLRGSAGDDIVAQLRQFQPHIAIVATPKNSETQSAVSTLELQNVIDTPLPVRQLIPVLQRAVQHARETLLSDTVEAPLVTSPERTTSRAKPEFTSLDAILETLPDVENRTETLAVDMSEFDLTPSQEAEAVSAFEQIAAEEPPLPGMEDNATIRDLRDSLRDTGARGVIEVVADVAPVSPLPVDESGDGGMTSDEVILAQKILFGMRDHTSPLKPLVEAVAPESASLQTADVFDELYSADEVSAAVEALAISDDLSAALPADLDDAALAQMALELTQASLELAAEASLLTRGEALIAAAGKLAQADIDALREQIIDDSDNDQQARIRFVTLASNGKDYMLYSRRTDGGFLLTMAFAGNMSLSVIRRQSDKLLAALAGETAAEAPDEIADETHTEAEPLSDSAPSQLVVAEAATPTSTAPLVAFTYIWMVRDPEQSLSDAVAQAIVAGLDFSLTQKGWMIHTLRVADDYVYLHARVPEDEPVSEVIATLKRLSAQIAAKKDYTLSPDMLWADAYFALLPGRELDTNEIQRFIRFGRM